LQTISDDLERLISDVAAMSESGSPAAAPSRAGKVPPWFFPGLAIGLKLIQLALSAGLLGRSAPVSIDSVSEDLKQLLSRHLA
jgi:hypothetical protein